MYQWRIDRYVDTETHKYIHIDYFNVQRFNKIRKIHLQSNVNLARK